VNVISPFSARIEAALARPPSNFKAEAMRKRKWLFVGIVTATVACAVPVVAYLFRDPINESACERIKEGMTEADVIRILGRPCDYLNYYEAKTQDASDGDWKVLERGERKFWHGPAGKVTVDFEDKTGTVQGVWFRENENSLWLRVRRWLGIDPIPRPIRG
jgi:hypothetical protein